MICLYETGDSGGTISITPIGAWHNTKLRSIMSRKSEAWSFRYSEERDTRIWTDARASWSLPSNEV